MKQNINFNWKFILDYRHSYINKVPRSALDIDLPHNMFDIPFNTFSDIRPQVIGTYFKNFDLKSYDKNASYFVRFEGVMVRASIYINGVFLGDFNGGYLPLIVDISDNVKQKDNLLVVKVDGRENKNVPPWGKYVDFLSFSGIYREVSIVKQMPLDIIDAKIDGKTNGDVRIRPKFVNDENVDFEAIYEVFDSENKLLVTATLPRFNVTNIKKWDLRNPNIYKLVITLKSKKNVIQKAFPLAFRSLEFKVDGFYLNGIKTPLIGTNRHETYPTIGAAASASLQVDDVKILKNLGFTYVRSSHYPPSPNFLDACDNLGLLVIDEVPGWRFIGDEAWQNHHLDNIEKMISRDYNHPSVIAWSIRINESEDHEDLYTRSNALSKKLDPYRPTTGSRNIKNSQLLEDIYSYNDFSTTTKKGLKAKAKIVKTNKPYIVSQAIGHTFPTKVYDGPLVQQEFVVRHLNALNDFYKHKNIIGLSTWCMHDYYTHKEFGAGDHISYHGILDSFRNPKHASFVYKANLVNDTIIHPTFSMDKGDIKGGNLIPFYVLSNVHHLDFFKDDALIKTFKPLKRKYASLPHAPYLINYFIPRDWNKDYPAIKGINKYFIGRILNNVALHGVENLCFKDKLYLKLVQKIYKLSNSDLILLFNNALGTNTLTNSVYSLVGYNKDNQKLATHLVGSSTHYHYSVVADKTELVNTSTYDTGKIVITSLNSNNMRNPYDFSGVSARISGNIRLSASLAQNLHGGALTIYVHSLSGKGEGSIELTINEHRFSFDYIIKQKGE